jgi:hypothetical protein
MENNKATNPAEMEKCAQEVQAILDKYGYTIVPFNQPVMKLVKLNKDEGGNTEAPAENLKAKGTKKPVKA